VRENGQLWRTWYYAATSSQTSPDVSVRARWMCQHPRVLNRNPVPHSSPGRRKELLWPCGSGPKANGCSARSGAREITRSGPVPVIRHTIFNSSPTRGGTRPGPNASPHTDASRLVPRIFTAPPAPNSDGVAHVARRDGWEAFELAVVGTVLLLSWPAEHAPIINALVSNNGSQCNQYRTARDCPLWRAASTRL
jgi:hypothetical protein